SRVLMTIDQLPTRSIWSSTSARDYHTPPGMSPRTSTPTVGNTDGPIIVRGIHQHHWPSGAAQTHTQGPTVPLIAATEFVNDIPQVIAAVNADQEETQFALL